MHALQITRMYKKCLLIFYFFLFCLHAKSLQSCPTLCYPMDCSPPYSSVHGILQARILEWVAMLSSRGIFPTQGSNLSLLCLLHWQAGSLPPVPPREAQNKFVPYYSAICFLHWDVLMYIFP